MPRNAARDHRRFPLLPLLALSLLLGGCESLNETLVRQWFLDRGLSHEVGTRIREGLQRREEAPPRTGPIRPAPEFLDQG